MPDLLTLARLQHAQIDRVDSENIKQITQVYLNMYDNLRGDIDALRLAIEALESPTVADIKRLVQYERLLLHSKRELERFNVYLETQIEVIGRQSLALGLSHSDELIQAYLQGRFSGLNTNVVAPLLNYLRRNGPLFARLEKITDATIENVVDEIIKGVSLGYNPRKIAASIQDAFGGGLTDALRNTRTVQLWAYRDGARANYQASGVVDKWIWYAELDDLTCGACIAEHGTLHDLTEQLDGHYNCRCAALPYIEGVTDQPETGEAWFEAKSEAEQRAILGDTKWEAWKDGKFEFSQLSQQSPNDVYGHMRSEASLKSLLEGQE